MTEETPSKGPIAWMAGNSVAANLLMLVLLLGGLLVGRNIKQEVFPEFSLDLIRVTIPYPGASPEEVEQSIVLAVEEAARGLDGVAEVTAVAAEGRGTVIAELDDDADPQQVAQDLQNEIDGITSFPEDAEEPRLAVATRRRAVISLVIFGDQEEMVLRETAEVVRERLQADPEITLVELEGVRPHEISIEIPQDRLREYGLTLNAVAQRVRNASVELPGGEIETPEGDLLLRVTERRDFGREFARVPVIDRPGGTPVYIEDIGTVRDAYADTDNSLSFNGQPAVVLTVYRVGDQTPIAIADAVRRHVDELKVILPGGLEAEVWSDQSVIYRQRAELLMRNAGLGLILVFILLSVFLESRLAFWVMLGIPVSFLGTFLLLPLFGTSLNVISMFAFIISLGIVVDDAVVVGENIYEHHQRGVPFARAAALATREIAMPVTFSVLTNIVAFLPLFFIPGFMGKVFSVIPAVVVIVFAMSLVESLFILPAHLGHQRDRRRWGIGRWAHERQQRFSRWFMGFVERRHAPLLRWCLHHRYLTVAVGVAILVATLGYVRSGRMGMQLFPTVESDYAFAEAILPFGSAVERTEQVKARLLAAAERVRDRNGGDSLVRGIQARITDGGHRTEVRIMLTDPGVRPISTAEVSEQWRKEVGPVPGLEYMLFQANRGGPGSGRALTVELSHRNIPQLERACNELAAALGEYPIVSDIDDGVAAGKRQRDFRMLPEGQQLGLTARDVARQVRHAFYGAEVLRQQRGRNELKVMVRYPESERTSEHELETFIVRTPDGVEVPLRDVVHTEPGRAYTEIRHRDGRRVVKVTANVTPPSRAGEIMTDLRAEILPDLVQRYSGLSYGFEGRQADRRESLSSLGRGFLMAMLIIYALLAIPFRSYIQPAIVMVSIPFGIVGAVIGHLIMGYSLSVLSMFGVVALSGVVVNDSLILIDFANRRRREGATAFDAILAAGVRRFRPIMLTTLTTFGGLAPMIFETSRQARFLIPMALSLGFGILFATGIILGLVPCLYLVVEDATRLWERVQKIARGEPQQ